MALKLYSQLLRLDLSNDHLLQMYYALYDDVSVREKELTENIDHLIREREKIKQELREHISSLKNSLKESPVARTAIEYLPNFVKLSYLARNTFTGVDWANCYRKERENIRLYYQTLYNQNISTSTVDILLKQKKKLEEFPKKSLSS